MYNKRFDLNSSHHNSNHHNSNHHQCKVNNNTFKPKYECTVAKFNCCNSGLNVLLFTLH